MLFFCPIEGIDNLFICSSVKLDLFLSAISNFFSLETLGAGCYKVTIQFYPKKYIPRYLNNIGTFTATLGSVSGIIFSGFNILSDKGPRIIALTPLKNKIAPVVTGIAFTAKYVQEMYRDS